MQCSGDSTLQKVSQMNKRKRGMDRDVLVECDDHIKRVSYSKYIDEKQPKKGKKTRLCADNMNLLKKHLNSMKRVHGASCNMCEKHTFMECQLCKKHVCFKSAKEGSRLSCCIDFHDDLLYGLGIMDRYELFGCRSQSLESR